MFEDTLSSKKNRKRSKLPQQNSNKRLSSSSNNTESDGETNSMKDEQMEQVKLYVLKILNYERQESRVRS